MPVAYQDDSGQWQNDVVGGDLSRGIWAASWIPLGAWLGQFGEKLTGVLGFSRGFHSS